MKGFWKKCLSLTAGLLALSAQTVAADAGVIARTPAPAGTVASFSAHQGSASPSSPSSSAAVMDAPAKQDFASWSAPESRPLAVTLERPRIIASTVEQTSYRQPTVRAQAVDAAPMPVETVGPTPRPYNTAPSFTAEQMPFTGPTPEGGLAPLVPEGMPGPATDAPPIDPDRFAFGDGVSHQFTNLVYVESETLFWGINGTKLPPLIVAMDPPMHTVLGGAREDTGWQLGHRIRAGFWFDRDHSIGFEGSYFFLRQDTTKTDVISNGNFVLGVPFLDAAGNNQFFPIAGAGIPGMGATALMNRLWGAEASVKGNLFSGPNGYVDLLGGLRVVGFDENLSFTTVRDFTPIMGPRIATRDEFAVRNQFWGGQLGVNAEYRYGRFSLFGTGRLALGGTNQVIKTSGVTMVGNTVAGTGLLVQRSNLGRVSRNEFAVLPEFGFRVGYQITDCLRATLGYNIFYLSDVVRPGESIDRVLGGNRPAFSFNSTSLWVHGVTAGMEFKY